MWRTPDNCVLIIRDDAPDHNDPTELLGWDIVWIDKKLQAERFHAAHHVARKLWGKPPDNQSQRAFCCTQDGSLRCERDYSAVEWMTEKYK